MKKPGFLAAAVAVQMLVFLTSYTTPYQRLSLESALRMGLASVAFAGTGGYQEQCVNATIKNLSGEAMSISFEPGRILNSHDPKEQDLLLVERTEVQLLPGDNKLVPLRGFCAQSTNNSPSAGSAYGAGRVDTGHVKLLAEFLAESNFPTNATQHAIWAFTNEHDVIGIHHRERDSTEKLLQFVCDLKGVPVPDITMEYLSGADGIPFNDRVGLVQVDFECNFQEPCKVVFNLYDRMGSIVKRVVLPINGNCQVKNHQVRMAVDDVKRGKYYLKAQKSGGSTLATYAVQI